MKTKVQKLFTLLAAIFFSFSILGQNIQYAHKIVDTLSSQAFHGRGYVFDGDKLAANYIKSELEKLEVKPLGTSYFQPFKVSANTFPKDIYVNIDGKELKAGTEFLPFPQSEKCAGKFNIEYLDKYIIEDRYKFRSFMNSDHSKNVVAIDTSGVKDEKLLEVVDFCKNFNLLQAKAIISVESGHLHGGISSAKNWFAGFRMSPDVINNNSQTIEIKLKPKFINDYETQNVIGYIEGESDSVIVFSAHYDHLGAIGNQVWFYGANDNASGVAMTLDLAAYYSQTKQKPKYSMAFLFFSSEEIGLLGSKYFNQNPLFPISKIKFLFNLDMVGTGEEGICLVNGKVFEKEANLLKQINEEKELLPDISLRGKAANSDHYFFYENGVRCFFIYARGGIGEYHNIYDKAETLPLTEFEDIVKLLTNFIERYE